MAIITMPPTTPMKELNGAFYSLSGYGAYASPYTGGNYIWHTMETFLTNDDGTRAIKDSGSVKDDAEMFTGAALADAATVEIPFVNGTNVVYFDGTDVIQEMLDTSRWITDISTKDDATQIDNGGIVI